MRDRSVVEVRAAYRRQAECLACGCVYLVGDPRRFVGTARTEEAARRDAESQAGAWAERRKPIGPCPGCGRLPAGVVASGRRSRHSLILGLALPAYVFVLVLGLLPKPHALNAVAVSFALVAVASGVAHAWRARKSPHGDPQTNLLRADRAIRLGDVAIVRDGEPSDLAPDARAARRRAVAALLVCVTATGAAVAAPVARVVCGWPANDRLDPEVCGPGDQVRVYFNHHVDAVEDHWSGSPAGTVEYEANGTTKRAPAVVSGRQQSWDVTRMTTKSRSSPTRPWAAVTIPGDAEPGGVVRVELEMRVKYPRSLGSDRFVDSELKLRDVTDIRLSPPGTAVRYLSLLWGGTLGGAALVVLLGFFLSETNYPARKSAIRVTAVPV